MFLWHFILAKWKWLNFRQSTMVIGKCFKWCKMHKPLVTSCPARFYEFHLLSTMVVSMILPLITYKKIILQRALTCFPFWGWFAVRIVVGRVDQILKLLSQVTQPLVHLLHLRHWGHSWGQWWNQTAVELQASVRSLLMRSSVSSGAIMSRARASRFL